MVKQPADGAGEPIPDDIAGLDFEAAMAALEEIVQKLESGEVGLEDSIAIYTRGALLKRHCEEKLRAATEKVERIVVGPAGDSVGVEPAEID